MVLSEGLKTEVVQTNVITSSYQLMCINPNIQMSFLLFRRIFDLHILQVFIQGSNNQYVL